MTVGTHVNVMSRRGLLRGLRAPEPGPANPVPRLPWAVSDDYAQLCTACGDCADACPEGVVVITEGHAQIDFSAGGCTFCGDCAQVCTQEVFQTPSGAGWSQRVDLSRNCLGHLGVNCQSCRDVCEARAITFAPRIGGTLIPTFRADLCTGCGACTGVCPADAFVWTVGANSTERDETHAS